MMLQENRPPRAVRLAVWGWVAAVGSGVIESVLAVTDALSTGSVSHAAIAANVALRAVVYGAVLAITAQLWNGRGWARIVLAVLLGGLGTLSLVIGPIQWLAGSRPDLDVDAMFVAFAFVRTLHLAAVWYAMAQMFRPTATTYLRSSVPTPLR